MQGYPTRIYHARMIPDRQVHTLGDIRRSFARKGPTLACIGEIDTLRAFFARQDHRAGCTTTTVYVAPLLPPVLLTATLFPEGGLEAETSSRRHGQTDRYYLVLLKARVLTFLCRLGCFPKAPLRRREA